MFGTLTTMKAGNISTRPAHRIALALLVGALALFVGLGAPHAAYALNSAFDETSSETQQYFDDYSGNAFLVNRDVTNVTVGCDLYWAGETLKASGITTGANGSGDALLAGQNLTLSHSEIRGSLRAAGMDVHIASSQIANNITVAGQTISVASNVSAQGLYAAGETLNIAGSYKSASLSADTVTLSGTFEGDVHISAAHIDLSDTANIKGTLYIPQDASFTCGDKTQANDVVASGLVGSGSAEGMPLAVVLGLLVFSCIAHVLLTLVYWYFGKDVIRDAATMSREHVGSLALTGLVVFFATPLLAVVLIVPIVTLPIVVLMGIVMVTVWLFSIPFAGAALGCQIFHKRSPRLAAVAGTLILTLLCYVPYLLPIIPTLASIYTIGYVGQKFLIRRRANKKPKANDPIEA